MQIPFISRNLFLYLCLLAATLLTTSCDRREQETADRKAKEARLLLKLLNKLDQQLKSYNIELITNANFKVTAMQTAQKSISETSDENRLEKSIMPIINLYISTCGKLEELNARDDIAVASIDMITLSKENAVEVRKIIQDRILSIKQQKASAQTEP